MRGTRGVTVFGAATTLVFAFAAPASAFAPVGGEATGFGAATFDDTAGHRLTTCQNVFSGHVTVDNGTGRGGEIRLEKISFSPCDPNAGISVTPNNLPWTFTLDSRAQLIVRGVDLNVVKRAGSCRYTGTFEGARSFDGVYTIFGALARRGTGCGGPGRLGFSVPTESVSVNGMALNP